MKIKKLNFIFSILFLAGCILFTGLLWQIKQPKDYEPRFFSKIKKYVNELYVVSGVVIVATFLNVLAYKSRHCIFYLMGIFGFSIFTLAHIGNILAQIHALIYKSNYLKDPAVFVFNFGFPLGLFGQISTLNCFQKIYIEKMKDEKLFINLGIKDFTKCVAIFNVAIILPFVLLFCYAARRWGYDSELFLFFIPTIFPVFNLLAIYFKNNKLCIVAIVGYVLFTACWLLCFGDFLLELIDRYQRYPNLLPDDFFIFVTALLAALTYIFVGSETTLYLCQEHENTVEIESTKTYSKNFISKTSFYLWESTKGFMV